jgi:serine/threonine protein phosphatase PrpC
VQIEIVTLSKQGGRPYNEDVFGQWDDGRFLACMVADGAGGHGGGDVAAATARTSMLARFATEPTLDAQALRGLLEQANRDVVARQAEGGRLAAMRTTAVLVAIDRQAREAAWVHTGDSRAYLYRAGALVARTVDHSLVQQLVAGGMIDEERARLHPQRNLLLSALGAPDGVIDIAASGRMPLHVGDALLLCSDGVWEPLGDACLAEMLQASDNATQWIEKIDAEISTHAKPGCDNYTAVVLWAQTDSE